MRRETKIKVYKQMLKEATEDYKIESKVSPQMYSMCFWAGCALVKLKLHKKTENFRLVMKPLFEEAKKNKHCAFPSNHPYDKRRGYWLDCTLYRERRNIIRRVIKSLEDK